MLSQKMAGGSMLRLIQGISNLNVYSMPWNISQRSIGLKAVHDRLQSIQKKPKKPFNAYFEFKAEVEPDILRKNSNLSIKDRAQLIAKLWKECPKEKKDKYKEIAQANLQKYKKEVENIEKTISPQEKAEIEVLKKDLARLSANKELKAERQKKLIELNKPKKPLNPYIRFVKSQGVSSGNVKEAFKNIGHKWTSMSENQKKSYIQEYEKELEEYNKKLIEWENKMISLGHVDIVRGKTLKEKVKMG